MCKVTIPFKGYNWTSKIGSTPPYSNLLNAYLQLMQLFPNESKRIGRAVAYYEGNPIPLDLATKSILGKKLKPASTGLKPLPEVVLLQFPSNHYDIQKFLNKSEVFKWRNHKITEHNLDDRLPLKKPRTIFAIARTTSGWIGIQNNQDKHPAFHAELQLCHWLMTNSDNFIKSFWSSLSPCRLCAAMILETQTQLNQTFSIFYGVRDSGRKSKLTSLLGIQVEKKLEEWLYE